MTRNTGIRREAFERCDWQAVIDAHPHESHAPQEWLDYSIALQQRLIPGPDATKQRQQIELAIMQAQNEGASAAAVAAALLDPVLLSLHEALAAVGMKSTARNLQEHLQLRQGWERIRIRAGDALLAGQWQEASALIHSKPQFPECQPPEGVNGQIWSELLLNSISATDGRLPGLKLVESRSLPRSGHHFLRHLLQQACGQQFSYCEGYQEPGCCKSSPCSVAAYWHYARQHQQSHLRMLKSHDFRLTDATFTPPAGMVRLVQVRRPLPLLASWLELQQLTLNREVLEKASIAIERIFLYHESQVLEEAWRVIDESGTVMCAEQAKDWLDNKVCYVQSFLKKWVPCSNPFPFGEKISHGNYLLRYEDLGQSSEILKTLQIDGDQELPLPVFSTKHPDVAQRRSKQVTRLIHSQLDLLYEADATIRDQLPVLADGSLPLM